MHPILFEIGLGFTAPAIVCGLFFASGVIGARFRRSSTDTSHLASWLCLDVAWGEIDAPWGRAIARGLWRAAAAATACAAGYLGVRLVAPDFRSIPCPTYDVLLALACVSGIALAVHRAPRAPLPATGGQGVDPARIVGDLAFYLVAAGLGGANVVYNLSRWRMKNFGQGIEVLMFWRWWELGLVWYGGLIASFFVVWWYLRRKQVDFWPYADLLMPSVALGHAIGRLGCFTAGCCFGRITDSSLAVRFPSGSPAFGEHLARGLITGAAERSAPVYPVQLFEALGELCIFLALLQVHRRKRFHGHVVLTYLFLYPLLRTGIEMLRGDELRGFFFRWPSASHPLLMSTSQGISVLVAAGSIALTMPIIQQRKPSPKNRDRWRANRRTR